MPQHLKTAVATGKRWGWHQVLFKDWLRAVQGGLTGRRYTKWLRTRKVFDRDLVEFCQRLLGIKAARGQAPRLSEVGQELIEELERSEREQAARQSQGPAEGEDVPTSGARVRRRLDDSALEAQNPELRKAPSADDDPFLRALLERFAELNPYLTRFTLGQIGEDFLSESELFRRIGSADYEALRPSMPLFQSWLSWLDWLGGIGKVGFRFRVTQAGGELYSYLHGIPLEELLADDESDEEPEEEPSPEPAQTSSGDADSAPGPAGPEAAVGAEGDLGFEGGDLPEDAFEDDFEDEGLDLPPEAEADPDAVPYWQQAPAEAEAVPSGTPAAQLANPEPEPEQPEPEQPEPEQPEPEQPKSAAEPSVSISSAALDRLFGGDVSAPPPKTALKAGTTARARAQARPRAVARAQGAAGSQAAPPAPSSPAPVGKKAATPRAESPATPNPAPAPTSTPSPSAPPAAAPGPSAVPTASASEPPASFGRTGSFGRLLSASGALARLPEPTTKAGVQLNRAALGLATEWWLAGPSPRPASGVELSPDPSGQPLAAFRLLALASLLEAEAPSAEARRLHAALLEAGALRALLVEQAPLERALEVAWGIGAPALLEERLVHLLRFRRGLLRLGDLGLRAGSARDLGRTLRDQVTGPTLGPGLLLVVAELCQAGYAPAADLSELAWLPDLSELAPPPAASFLESS